MRVPAWLVDIAERSGTAFLAVFIAVVSAAPAGVVSWGAAADQGAFALLVALVSSSLLQAANVHFVRPIVDIAWRAGMQFGQSLLAVLVTSKVTSVVHFQWTYALHIALIATAGVILKGFAGAANRSTVGASTLVKGNSAAA